MNGSPGEILTSKPQRLAKLMTFILEPPAGRCTADLPAELKFQLDTPLMEVIRARRRGVAQAGAMSALQRLPAAQSVRELFHQPEPPLEWLRAVKEAAQKTRKVSTEPHSRKAATMIYYAAIALALVHRNARITRLTDPQLVEGFQWVLAQAWAEDLVRRPVSEACLRLKASS